jgi:DNA polymerase-3 subunit delta'
VTGFSSLIAQHQPVKILNAILRRGKVPHALLFTGIEGVGKRTAAISFAMALNCKKRKAEPAVGSADGGETLAEAAPPCAHCRSCRKIESGNHPDIIRVKPTGPFIRIDQIRELCSILAMKPYEAEYRTVLISEAHRMNAEAGNALLKMLEEPPARTILILTAVTAADMLPTIVSRCRHIRFNPIPFSRLARELMETEEMTLENAQALAVLSGGSLSKARELPKNNWLQRRRWLLDNFDEFFSGRHPIQRINRLFAMASVLYPNKDLAVDCLEILKTIYRDILVSRYQPENLLNLDGAEFITDAANRMEEGDIMAAIGAIDTALDRIRGNANARLVLETLFLTLAKSPEMH